MQFYEPTTCFSELRHIIKVKDGNRIIKDPLEWYPAFEIYSMKKPKRSHPKGSDNDLTVMRGEETWYAFGKPYYKVYPHMATAMSEVSIDIPVGELKLPYPAFIILLANDHQNDFYEPNGPRLRSIMCSEFRVDNQPEGRFKTNMLSGSDRAFFIAYTFDLMEHDAPVQCNYFMSLANDAGTLEQYFQVSYEKTAYEGGPGNYLPGKDLVHRIMRLAIATCFFGIDEHEMVMPDLPRRKIERRASQKGISLPDALKELSREINTTKMWTIGREISLPQPEFVKKEGSTDPERHEITHAYMRRGHMRWQKTGEGRKDRKLVFVHPHVVRPDLPWATARGYRIPDENLERVEK